MNIIKIQDQLRGVPDNTLVGYVQNPTGQVPTYLALSELQRRKEMRSKYQASQPEDKTVAEDLVQEVQPGVMGLPAGQSMQQAMQPPPEMPMEQMAQGGLAELDVGDMYDEKNYANGGIVAFADGGTSRLGDYFSNLRAKNLAAEDIDRQLNQLISERARLKYDVLTPLTEEQKAAQDKTIPQIDAMIADLQAKKSGANVTAPTSTTGGPRIDATQLPKSITGIGDSTLLGPSVNALNQMTTPPAPATTTAVKTPGMDLGGLYQPLPDYSKDYAALYQDPAGMAEKEMARYRSLIGEDTMRPKLEEKLKKMEDRATKMEEQAPWLALAKAGFEMASAKPEYGKGQSAIADIARGAGVGIKDYADARDKLETLRDKHFDVQAKLAQAKRAEDVAAATHGINSEQHIKAQNQANKLAELSYKYTRDAANQKNKIDAFEAVNKGEYYKALGAEAKAKAENVYSKESDLRTLYDNYMKGSYFQAGLPTGLTYDQFKQYVKPDIPADVNSIVNKYLPK